MPESTQPRQNPAPDTDATSDCAPASPAEAPAGPGRAGDAKIVSASYRTDIPCFHAAWFSARLKAGFCHVQNPYGRGSRLVRLDPASAHAFVFWTRNAKPFVPVLENLSADGRPFVVQMTITGYPKALEAATLAPAAAVRSLRALARRFGRRAVVWRYDPIVLGTLTPPAWHARTFEHLARALEGAVDEVVISFVQPYRKTVRNMNAAGRAHGFDWCDAGPAERASLAATLRDIAAAHGIRFSVCGMDDALNDHAQARCIDARRLSDIAGRAIAAGTRSHRKGCACAQSVDIGAYDTCTQGCAYCYAVSSRARAKDRLARMDPAASTLGAPAPGAPLLRAPAISPGTD